DIVGITLRVMGLHHAERDVYVDVTLRVTGSGWIRAARTFPSRFRSAARLAISRSEMTTHCRHAPPDGWDGSASSLDHRTHGSRRARSRRRLASSSPENSCLA